MPKQFFYFLGVLLTLCVLPSSVLADVVVAPNSVAGVAGAGSQFPFSINEGRFLNVYNADQFLSSMPTGGRINSIAFRIDESVSDDVLAIVPDLEIRLSTSPSVAPQIPPLFSANVGRDETLVFSGSFEGPVGARLANGLHPFAIIFNLQKSFDYDPRNGGLAVDLVNHSTPPTQQVLLDAANSDLSVATGGALVGFNHTDLSFNFAPELALQLTFTPIPEPSATLVMLAGMLVYFLMRRYERN